MVDGLQRMRCFRGKMAGWPFIQLEFSLRPSII